MDILNERQPPSPNMVCDTINSMTHTPEQIRLVKMAAPALLAYAAFSESRHGKLLADQVRFGRFFEQAGVTKKQWEVLMGRDVNNLRHMAQILQIASWYARTAEDLDDEQRSLIVLAGAIHDQAESVVGDIPYGQKTDELEAKEHDAFSDYENDFTRGLSLDTLDKYRIAHKIAFASPTGNKLAADFEQVELLGFASNIITASHQIRSISTITIPSYQARAVGISSDEDRSRVTKTLERLRNEVFSSVVDKLIDGSNRRPNIIAWLIVNKDGMTQGISEVKQKDFEWYDDGSSEKRWKSFDINRKLLLNLYEHVTPEQQYLASELSDSIKDIAYQPNQGLLPASD